jgi:23S rRNA pseudouridine1911/1915/1917 synthase
MSFPKKALFPNSPFSFLTRIGEWCTWMFLMESISEETILQSKVPFNSAGKSLLDYLSHRFRYQARESWAGLIREGKVTVNGKKAEPALRLQKGDRVAYSVILQEPPVDRKILILHEEESFLVAFKPGQLPSHADGNFIRNTFIYLITQMLRNKGWKGDIRLVHRLDRETSGLMVVAKNRSAHSDLVRQFEQGLVKKEYMAVAKGRIQEETFEVNRAIGRDPESQISIRQKAVPPGTPFSKPSLTLFEKLKVLKDATLLKCIPKTGRTNQIRVHLDSIGHPILGDKLYGRTDGEYLEFIRHVKAGGDPAFPGHSEVPRHLLHASKLAFAHPETGTLLEFEAPLPPDMKGYIQTNSI